MPKCIVPGCTSGYDSNPEKFHFFTIPNDPKAVELWGSAVKRKDAKPRQAVCQNHFKPEEILWQRRLLGADGSVLGVSPYKRPCLAKDTVPSVFPWVEVTKPTEATLPLQTDSFIAEINVSSLSLKHQQVLDEDKENASPPLKSLEVQCQDLPIHEENDRSTVDPAVGVEHISSVPLTFAQLSAAEIYLFPGWFIQRKVCENTNLIILCTTKCVNIDGAYEPFILKAVTVKDDLSIIVSVLGKRVDMQRFNFPCSITDMTQLQELLRTIDRMNVCKGCTGSSVDTQMSTINCSTVCKDSSGMWRHQECSLLLLSVTICKFCRNRQKTLSTQLRRWKTGQVKKKRHNAPNSPTLKSKISRLRDNLRATKVSKVKAVGKCKSLKAELKISQTRMTRCTDLEYL